MKILAGILMFVSFGVVARAQTPPTPVAPVAAEAKVIAEIASSNMKGVKNSPFSADAVSESVQTLADGNRIVRNSTSKLYRNSEGRFRQEITGGTGGMLGSFFSYGPDITIMHPFEGQRFQLDDGSKTVHVFEGGPTTAVRIVPPTPMIAPGAPVAATKILEAYRVSPESKAAIEKLQAEVDKAKVSADEFKVYSGQLATTVQAIAGIPAIAGRPVLLPSPKYDTRTEDLGDQNIEGVSAKGTRTITTIPAGAIGNERPIETVYEKWYSDELQMVVYSKHSDPRFGEQTYRLTNINRSEPDPTLFQVPQGYKVISGNQGGAYTTINAAKAQQAELAAASKAGRPVLVKKTKNQN